MSESAFDSLVKGIFDWYVDFNPVFATDLGLHQFDHLMPNGTREAKLQQISDLKSFRARLREIRLSDLPPPKQIDYEVLRHYLDLWIFEEDELRMWESFPEAPFVVGDSVFSLFLRGFAPLDERLHSITARLEKAPLLVEELRDRLVKPKAIYVEIGLETCGTLPSFLETINDAGKATLEATEASKLTDSCAKTKEAIDGYARWLKKEVLPRAAPDFAIGSAKLAKYVKLREFGMDVSEIYALGKKLLRQSRKELDIAAKQVDPKLSTGEVVTRVKSNHPKTFREVLDYTEKVTSEARQFVISRHLISVPPNDEFQVVETPEHLRHLVPFAMYSPPGRFEKRQLGLYFVTPCSPDSEMMRENNFASIKNTSVHEAFPGHHLQQVCANLNPSLVRLLRWSVETVEGWAHYCEELMMETGFSHEPEVRVTKLLDQIWRACRIIVDIDLHRGKMKVDDAVGFLVREVGMERPAAIAEVKRYTYTPTYQLSYLLGKHLIVQLRQSVRKKLGSMYQERFFNDTLLYAGPIPAKYLAKLMERKVRELRSLQKEAL